MEDIRLARFVRAFAVAGALLCAAPFAYPAGAAEANDNPPSTVSSEWKTVWPSVIKRAKSDHGRLPAPDNLSAWASAYTTLEKALQAAEVGVPAAYGVTVEPGTLNGVSVLSITPKIWTDDGRILIYIHGGAFTFLSARSTIFESALMANRSGIKIVSIDYTPAPWARWREITDQAIAVYRAILKEGHNSDQIGIWGDSAGGSIVAGATLKLRDQGLPLPGAIILWAPWSDVSMAGDTYATLAAADPLLNVARLRTSASAYADPIDQKNPYVSPVYGDYSKGFPPTLIQCGTREIFLSNCVREYQAISQAGISSTLDVYEGMVHVFQPMAPDSPEGRAAMAKSVAFWNSHLRIGHASAAK
jgi:acetyl esterase/lipase